MQDLVCQIFHLFFSTNCSVSNSGCWLNVGINRNETLNIQCVTHLVWGNAINTLENECEPGKAKAWLSLWLTIIFIIAELMSNRHLGFLEYCARVFSCEAYAWHSSQHYLFFLILTISNLHLSTLPINHHQICLPATVQSVELMWNGTKWVLNNIYAYEDIRKAPNCDRVIRACCLSFMIWLTAASWGKIFAWHKDSRCFALVCSKTTKRANNKTNATV